MSVLAPEAAGAANPPVVSGVRVSDPAALVNPFIGTANGGNTFPGADVPFGMVQWSPDTTTRPDGGGYDYHAPAIIGYSLTHLSGPGCPAEGDLPVLPTIGTVGPHPALTTEPLDHGDETATPGYYQLEAGAVDTQLTTTTRSGTALFTFPADTAEGNLLFKLADSEVEAIQSQFRIVNDEEVEGQITTGYFCGARNNYTLYFNIVFDRPFTASGTWKTILHGTGFYLSFATAKDSVVEAKVGLSM